MATFRFVPCCLYIRKDTVIYHLSGLVEFPYGIYIGVELMHHRAQTCFLLTTPDFSVGYPCPPTQIGLSVPISYIYSSIRYYLTFFFSGCGD